MFVFNRRLAAARHNPSKLGFCARLAQTLSFLIKPRGILSSKMTKPRGKTLVFLTKPRGMNDFVKPNEQSSSLLEYSAMARKRLLKTNLWHEKIFCKFTGFSNDNHNKQQKSLHPEGIGKKSRGKKQKSEEQNRLLFCSSFFNLNRK